MAEPMRVWAVVVGAYEPPEVLGLYTNEAAARMHADENVGDLRVAEMAVADEYTEE